MPLRAQSEEFLSKFCVNGLSNRLRDSVVSSEPFLQSDPSYPEGNRNRRRFLVDNSRMLCNISIFVYFTESLKLFWTYMIVLPWFEVHLILRLIWIFFRPFQKSIELFSTNEHRLHIYFFGFLWHLTVLIVMIQNPNLVSQELLAEFLRLRSETSSRTLTSQHQLILRVL